MKNRLNSRELLLIAEEAVHVPYKELEEAMCPYRAEAALAAPFLRICGSYLFPDPADQAAICAAQIIRTQPFPFGNQKIGYECMREMLVRSPYRWVPQMEEAEDVAGILKRVELHKMSLGEFLAWVRKRVVKA